MAYFQLQSTFDKGEISPLLGSRSDVDFWRASLEYCRNFNVLTHGGLRRRSGTIFIAEVADSTQYTRLLPFKFSEEQAYVLALNGNGTMRFLSERAQLYSGASPYTISQPFSAAVLPKVSYDQFNDAAYFAHKDVQPRKLLRAGNTNWSMQNVVFNDGPYMDKDDVATTLAPGDRGSITISGQSSSGAIPGGFDQYDLAFAQSVDNYWITSTSDKEVGDSPNGWTLSGWDGSAWVVIDEVEGQSGWLRSERHYFETDNKRAFTKYRFDWKGPQSSDSTGLRWGNIGMHRVPTEQTPTTLTASSTIGINGGTGFVPTDVGRSVRIMGPSSRWQWAKITSYVSATQVMVQLYGHVLLNTAPIASWRMDSFSPSSGWPGCVRLFDERIMWARTNSQPVTVFGSKQGNFDDYGQSNPTVETDGLSITLLSSNQNEILWLADDEDLATGSAGQIRTIGPADLNKSFSATNIAQRKGPTSGAAHLGPLSIGGVTLYAGAGATKIRELVLGDQNRYVAPELSLLGEHLFKPGITDWAFCERPDPQIYCAMGDGSLVSVTYDREQKIVGFAKHEIAKGFVESVAVVPGVQPGYDDLYLVVRRVIGGQTKRYIEVLERPFDGDIDTIDDSFHVDCGAVYSGSPIQTVTGLWFLEGEQVIALADGNVVDSRTDENGMETPLIVSGGAVTLPYAASRISIGLRYLSRAITLPIAGPQQDGTLFGRNKTVISAMVDLLNSGSCRLGCAGDKDWQPPITEQAMKRGSELFGSKLELRSGFIPCDLDGSWLQGGGRIIMETDEPLPLLIRSLVMQLESTP
nr:hypothetical protein [Brucella intermedia]